MIDVKCPYVMQKTFNDYAHFHRWLRHNSYFYSEHVDIVVGEYDNTGFVKDQYGNTFFYLHNDPHNLEAMIEVYYHDLAHSIDFYLNKQFNRVTNFDFDYGVPKLHKSLDNINREIRTMAIEWWLYQYEGLLLDEQQEDFIEYCSRIIVLHQFLAVHNIPGTNITTRKLWIVDQLRDAIKHYEQYDFHDLFNTIDHYHYQNLSVTWA